MKVKTNYNLQKKYYSQTEEKYKLLKSKKELCILYLDLIFLYKKTTRSYNGKQICTESYRIIKSI